MLLFNLLEDMKCLLKGLSVHDFKIMADNKKTDDHFVSRVLVRTQLVIKTFESWIPVVWTIRRFQGNLKWPNRCSCS